MKLNVRLVKYNENEHFTRENYSLDSFLQIVGNLLYYRYINSAIVAPDAFDIINVTADKQLTNDQRRNLGSVAKILQFAASNKGVSAAHYINLMW